jgi:hypothetical protein
MKTSLEVYRQSRGVLLTSLITELSADERCVAAWLTGSYARNDADEVSDLDLTVVIADPYSDLLCARQEQVSPKTTPERLALFSKFGNPALIHENNNNAPEGGTFTFILYSGSALMIDWTLRPQRSAERPFQSVSLFDRANIPVSPAPAPDDLEQSKKSVAETWAFFWMMTAITIKYAVRQDDVFVTRWLEVLHGLIEEIQRQLHREPQQYMRGSLSKLQPTRAEQIESIRSLCSTMKSLAPQIEEFSGKNLLLPSQEIETLLALADEEHARH